VHRAQRRPPLGGPVTGSILRKEIHDLKIFAWIGLALLLIDLLDAFTQQTDISPLGKTYPELGQSWGGFHLLVAFAVGTGLLMREIDERTLAFLDGLPVSRTRIFITKMSVALAVLLLYPTGRVLSLVASHLISRGSLDHALHPNLLAAALGSAALVTLVGLSLGILCGYLRSLAWMTLGLAVVALFEIIEKWPRLAALNPLSLLEPRYVGDTWAVPTSIIAAQIALTAASTLAAWWLFVTGGTRMAGILALFLKRPVISALVAVATVVVGFFAIDLWTDTESKSDPPDSRSPDTVIFTPSPAGHAATNHYSFSYPAHSTEGMRRLLSGADAAYEHVQKLLEVQASPPIDVDLWGSEANSEGTAFFSRIRMNLTGADPIRTLAHETTHVFAKQLAGGEHERELSKMPVLDEGLATWVEDQVGPDDAASEATSEARRLQAAVVSKRRLVTAPMLTDFGGLARSQDQNLKYPLGAVLIDVLVARYGPDAPHKLLTTLGQPDFPRDLEGLELWQTAFQLAGFDLGLIFDDYAQRLEEWEHERARTIAELPRLWGALVRSDSDSAVGVEVRMDKPVPRGWRCVVRFRPREDSPTRDYVTRGLNDGIAWIPDERFDSNVVCFQPGLHDGEVTLYEAWTCLPKDSAGEVSEEESGD